MNSLKQPFARRFAVPTAVIVGSLALAACSANPLSIFIDHKISGSDFNAQLAKAYQAAAKAEAAFNPTDARIFYAQGLAALAGQTPPPLDPNGFGVGTMRNHEKLSASRSKLVSALGRQTSKTAFVAKCANAQAKYDVWLENESDNDLGLDGNYFGGPGGPIQNTLAHEYGFQVALAQCQGRAPPPVPASLRKKGKKPAAATTAAAPKTKAKAGKKAKATRGKTAKATRGKTTRAKARAKAVAAAPQKPLPKGRPVVSLSADSIAFDSADVGAKGSTLAERIARSVRNDKRAVVVVIGHADTSGPASYNLGLGKRRALSMARILQRAGVNNVDTRSAGETKLAVPTPDNVREPRNRRVVVEVYPSSK